MDAMAEQGLNSKPVARADYFACTFIVNQKRPHAIQALHALMTPFAICVQENFRITSGPETVSMCLELSPQLDEVVDLAIENDGGIAIR